MMEGWMCVGDPGGKGMEGGQVMIYDIRWMDSSA